MIKEQDIYRFKKEKVKEALQKKSRINEILLIHPNSRSKEEEMELAELLLDYPAF
jgi:hypothetical protein